MLQKLGMLNFPSSKKTEDKKYQLQSCKKKETLFRKMLATIVIGLNMIVRALVKF